MQNNQIAFDLCSSNMLRRVLILFCVALLAMAAAQPVSDTSGAAAKSADKITTTSFSLPQGIPRRNRCRSGTILIDGKCKIIF